LVIIQFHSKMHSPYNIKNTNRVLGTEEGTKLRVFK
jgi:hypothetical protein